MTDIGRFFESLVLPDPRPYVSRQRNACRRVRDLLAADGNPHLALACLHLAGSKGKGSTALYAEALLQSLGYRTGTFLSPHLSRWTERFRVGGAEVDEASVEAAVDRLAPTVAALRCEHPDSPPSFFDTLTALAFHLFREHGVNVGIIETGLGGRYDATAVTNSRVSCITSIEYEHTDKLGTSLREIAAHKAGIIKPAVPVVVGPVPAAALEVIAREARERCAPLRHAGEHFRLNATAESGRSRLHYADGTFNLETTLAVPSETAGINAGLALDCVRLLHPSPLHGEIRRLTDTLTRVHLPGRTEVLDHGGRRVVVDCAHTEASARALARLLDRQRANRVHLLVSFTVGKNIEPVLEILLPHASRLTLTCAEPTRSLDPDRVLQRVTPLAPGLCVRVEPSPEKALRDALEDLGPQDLLCVAGSVYLAGIARETLVGGSGDAVFDRGRAQPTP